MLPSLRVSTPEQGPVPSFESLTLTAEPVAVSDTLRAQLPRIARTGADEAVLVYAQRGPRGPRLVSRSLRGLFSSWPPQIGEPKVHSTTDNYNSMGELVGWPDGTFAVQYGSEWVLAAVDQEGARATLKSRCFPDPGSDAVYVLEREADRTRVLRRAQRNGEGHVNDCGLLPKDLGFSAAVSSSGSLFLAGQGPTPEVRIFVASAEGVKTGATLALPQQARVSVLSRPGGAFLVVASHGSCVLHTLDDAGHPCGEPWSPPAVSPYDARVASSSWRDGCALATTRGSQGVGLLVTDGTRATFSEATVREVMSTMQLAGLLSNDDGSALVFAYPFAERTGNHGLRLARYACGPGDAVAAFVPNAEAPPSPQAASAKAASPAPPPRAKPSPFGTRDALVLILRKLSLFAALGQLDEAGPAAGSLREGHFSCSDGQGNHFVAHWDASGVVVLGFDHEGNSEWNTPLDLRDPGQHLPKVPEALKPLALRATDWGERLATEGLWIAAGEPPAYGQSTELEVFPRLIGLRRESAQEPYVLWPETSDPTSQLLTRIAQSESYVLSKAEVELLTGRRTRRRQRPIELATGQRQVAALARLGVAWPDAEAHVSEWNQQAQEAIVKHLPEHDHALLLAAGEGDLDRTKQALESGAGLDCRMPAGLLPYAPEKATPLLVALYRGHSDIAEHLIESGADVEARVATSHGGGSALRLAASQGNLRIVRLLLERGASAEPEVASWGLLQAVCNPPGPQRRGTPADYAEVIRLLLEAGAPLPNDVHCEMLVRVVSEAGALELVPKLQRVYAEDVLPEAPPAVDPAVVPQVTLLLARANDLIASNSVEALRLLSEAWLLDPLPRLVAAAETLARQTRGASPGLITKARGGIDGETTLRSLLAARQAKPDPRTSRELLGWLQEHDIYTDKTLRAKCVDAAAALLVHARDLRFSESLAQHCEQRPIGAGPTRQSLRVALRLLQETKPAPLEEAGERELARLEDALAGRRFIDKRPSVHALFSAVYDAPEDDAARHALAARLIEAGDERGELIALQLARHAKGGKPSKREKQLLEDNARRWLGEIEPIVGADFVYERGFLWQATSAERVGPLGSGSQREWSTVRRLSLWRRANIGTAGLLRGSALLGLRELCEAGPADVLDLLAGPVRPLERLDFAFVRRLDWWAQVAGPVQERLAEKLPGLCTLRVPSGDGGVVRQGSDPMPSEWQVRQPTKPMASPSRFTCTPTPSAVARTASSWPGLAATRASTT